MRIWIEFKDLRVKEYEVDSLEDAVELAKTHSKTLRDWDISSFRDPPSPPEPKEEIKYLPC